MAAKKEKVISFKGEEAEELILSYLKSQNRPYGATDISANLKSKVSKIQAQKSLAVLHEKGEILGKVYGKTTVYCALQTESDELESIDTTTLESEIISLKAKEVELKSSLKLLVQERTKLNSEPQTKDLNSTLSNIITKSQTLKLSLATSSNSSTISLQPETPAISPESLLALSNKFNQTKLIALKRAKIGKELQSILLEMFEGRNESRGKESGVEGEEGGDNEGGAGGGEEESSDVWELVGGESRVDGVAEKEEEVWKSVKEVEEVEKGKK